MPSRLKRYYGDDHLHFLTWTCYHRQRWLGGPNRRDLFLHILEEARRRYRFVLMGYVVMPEHVHLLISEPEHGTPSTFMQVVKQRFARRVLRRKRASSAQLKLWGGATTARMAETVPRFQCLERAEACGEVAVYASQSGEARTGTGTGTVGMEQLSWLCAGRRGCRETESVAKGRDESAERGVTD